jgi:drug/metabolite transporter (DMT)-like permease
MIASVAGVVGALIPVLVGIVTEGLPTAGQTIGIILALFGIWLVTQILEESTENSMKGLKLAVFAGACFGGFMALIALVETSQIFAPLAVAKLFSIGVAFLMLKVNKHAFINPSKAPAALLAGLLDASGNSLFLLATQYTRLDVAAILSSLYPASTVLLARLILGQRVSSVQWLGVFVCLVAIIFVTI